MYNQKYQEKKYEANYKPGNSSYKTRTEDNKARFQCRGTCRTGIGCSCGLSIS